MHTFEKLINDFEVHGGRLQSHCHQSLAEFKAARREAYTMTVAFKTLKDHHQPQLRDYLIKQGFKGPNLLNDWMDRWFAPFTKIGGDCRALLAAIKEKGMSLKAYLANDPEPWLKAARRITRNDSSDRQIPCEPPPSLSEHDQMVKWKARAIAFEEDNRLLRQENKELRQSIEGLERRMNKITDVLKPRRQKA